MFRHAVLLKKSLFLLTTIVCASNSILQGMTAIGTKMLAGRQMVFVGILP